MWGLQSGQGRPDDPSDNGTRTGVITENLHVPNGWAVMVEATLGEGVSMENIGSWDVQANAGGFQRVQAFCNPVVNEAVLVNQNSWFSRDQLAQISARYETYYISVVNKINAICLPPCWLPIIMQDLDFIWFYIYLLIYLRYKYVGSEFKSSSSWILPRPYVVRGLGRTWSSAICRVSTRFPHAIKPIGSMGG